MKILVTGGCGFIGAVLVRFLVERAAVDLIVNVDALTYAGFKERLGDLERQSNYRFIQANICNRDAIEKLFREVGGFDAVINVAAESHVDRSIADAKPFVWSNIIGTQVLLDVARAYPVKRFLQVSTDEVYGPAAPGEFFDEESTLRPSSPYAASKAAGDMLCQAAWKTHQVPILIARACNTYGPFQYPEKLIPVLIARALQKELLPLYGDGKHCRTWIHVEDHARALLAVFDKGRIGQTYNIATRDERSNLDVATKILDVFALPHSFIQRATDRPGHDFRYGISTEKAKRELNWQPRISFEESFGDTVEWYRKNTAWLTKTNIKV